ncbi:MAG: hypothetical protein ACRD0L_15815 [Acidimicrobiales bacterium]
MRRALMAAGIPRRERQPPVPALEVEPEVLGDLYVTQRAEVNEIARHYRVAPYQVRLALRRAGIRRPIPGRARPASPAPRTLERLYLQEGLTLAEIGQRYGVAAPSVRRWLDAAGIPVAPRTTREHRLALPVEVVEALYEEEGWSAAEVAEELGTTMAQVLRVLHDHGLAVRVGSGPVSVDRPAAPTLLSELYSDRDVQAALRAHGVPSRPQGGSIAERFPVPVALSPSLLARLYVDVGLSARHVELLTGQPVEQVLEELRAAKIAVRGPSERSPWRQRLVASKVGRRDPPPRSPPDATAHDREHAQPAKARVPSASPTGAHRQKEARVGHDTPTSAVMAKNEDEPRISRAVVQQEVST